MKTGTDYCDEPDFFHCDAKLLERLKIRQVSCNLFYLSASIAHVYPVN